MTCVHRRVALQRLRGRVNNNNNDDATRRQGREKREGLQERTAKTGESASSYLDKSVGWAKGQQTECEYRYTVSKTRCLRDERSSWRNWAFMLTRAGIGLG